MGVASPRLKVTLEHLEAVTEVTAALEQVRLIGRLAWAAWASSNEREMNWLAEVGVSAESLAQGLDAWGRYLRSINR